MSPVDDVVMLLVLSSWAPSSPESLGSIVLLVMLCVLVTDEVLVTDDVPVFVHVTVAAGPVVDAVEGESSAASIVALLPFDFTGIVKLM